MAVPPCHHRSGGHSEVQNSGKSRVTSTAHKVDSVAQDTLPNGFVTPPDQPIVVSPPHTPGPVHYHGAGFPHHSPPLPPPFDLDNDDLGAANWAQFVQDGRRS